ncbi:MAG TPA: hypothetical protein VH682_10480 [Gemmataceae bacterium]
MANIAKASLPPAGQRFVELMQRLHFGQILDLRIRAGQPVLNPLPRRVRDRKLGSDPAPRLASPREDFLLKEQVLDLFAYFDQIGDGVIDLIEVKHGLPFRLQHTEPPA